MSRHTLIAYLRVYLSTPGRDSPLLLRFFPVVFIFLRAVFQRWAFVVSVYGPQYDEERAEYIRQTVDPVAHGAPARNECGCFLLGPVDDSIEEIEARSYLEQGASYSSVNEIFAGEETKG